LNKSPHNHGVKYGFDSVRQIWRNAFYGNAARNEDPGCDEKQRHSKTEEKYIEIFQPGMIGEIESGVLQALEAMAVCNKYDAYSTIIIYPSMSFIA
jgi:actin-related protein